MKEYTIRKASKILNISKDTLRRYSEKGLIKTYRDSNGYRIFSEESLSGFIRKNAFVLAQKWVFSDSGEDFLREFYFPYSDFFRIGSEKIREVFVEDGFSDQESIYYETIIGEIGNNSFDHNLGKWTIPGVLMIYNGREIVLADKGVGVLNTLKEIIPGLDNYKDALRVAFTEIVSGRSPESRGNGLKYVRSIIENGKIKAELQFFSGDYVVVIKPRREMLIKKGKKFFNGCIAKIKIIKK